LENQTQMTFVTHDDIRHLPGMEEQTIIAVRAQAGTRLEVPDPDCGGDRPYQIFLKSEFPIDVYLVSQMEEEQRENDPLSTQKPSIYDPHQYNHTLSYPCDHPGLITPEIDYYTSDNGGITEFYVDPL